MGVWRSPHRVCCHFHERLHTKSISAWSGDGVQYDEAYPFLKLLHPGRKSNDAFCRVEHHDQGTPDDIACLNTSSWHCWDTSDEQIDIARGNRRCNHSSHMGDLLFCRYPCLLVEEAALHLDYARASGSSSYHLLRHLPLGCHDVASSTTWVTIGVEDVSTQVAQASSGIAPTRRRLLGIQRHWCYHSCCWLGP